MDESDLPKKLKPERDRTDSSLSAERESTDRSLKNARNQAEIATDENLLAARSQARREETASRQDSDLEHKKVNKDRRSVPADDVRDDARMLTERARADLATEKERLNTEAAIKQEREIKQGLVHIFVSKERAQTDLHLGEERSQTDIEVERVSSLLSKEKVTHSKTKAALTTRDEFLAIVSHDLRNPIGAVFSCAEMLLEDSRYEKMDSEMRNWIEFMKRNSAAAVNLISDILDMERIAEGKLTLQLQEYPILPVVQESMENFILSASNKSILLRSKVKNDIGKAVFDRDRIKQVLENLIGNAIKFTPEGGTIVLDAVKKDNIVLISVCDSGPGIPPEKRNNIFERFAQIGVKDRRGLGLGLYISKMLVEEHHGKIWVESQSGKGSTFWIAIPAKAPGDSDIH